MYTFNQHSLIRSTLFIILLFTFACGQSQENDKESQSDQASTAQIELTSAWELKSGIERPESAVFDSGQGVIFISNMAGGATEKDGGGYISKITPGGKMVEEQWAEGMNAPKGLAISGKHLYTADIDELVEINLESGEVTKKYPSKNAQFLNDVTADSDGNVYVSDSWTSTVYRLHDGSFEVWLQGDQIKSPNGLYAEADRLVVAACGIESDNPGNERYLQAVSYGDREVTPLGKEDPIGGLDAVQPNGRGGYFLTDWGASKVLTYNAGEGATLLREISKGTADLDYLEDQKLLVIPIMMSDKVLAFEVN